MTEIRKFQVVSDVHIEGLYNSGKKMRDVIVPCAKNLIIAGDLGRVENSDIFRATIKELCKMFAKVILVPGNHEYYAMGQSKIQMEDVDLFLYNLCREEGSRNLIVLNNTTTVVDDVLIFGSTFWSFCPPQYYNIAQLYRNSKLVDALEYNKMHFSAVKKLTETLLYVHEENLKLLIVTHHAPSFQGTLAKKHIVDEKAPAKGNMKNYMYCSDNLSFANDPAVIAWIYGHTGHNGNIGKLITNQIDKETGLKDAVLTINIPPIIPKVLQPSLFELEQKNDMMDVE